MSFALGANRESKERVKGKADWIQSSRIGSVLVCVRRNAQLGELKLLESTRLVLSTVVMIAVSKDGPTGCLVHLPPLSPQNIQPHEKSPAGHGASCGSAPTTVGYCFSYCYNARGPVHGNNSSTNYSAIPTEKSLQVV